MVVPASGTEMFIWNWFGGVDNNFEEQINPSCVTTS